jgi:DNA-binding transcriptional LysR family regulator
MDIHQLHVFTAVYRAKSFTRAARQIDISQPTVSEHIKNLENELECRLFDRIGRTIEPTASARILYPKALQIVGEVAEVRAELLGGEDKVKGEIVFGASTIPGTYLIPTIIKRFQEVYPDIYIQVRIGDSSEINRLILENELFCGIVGAQIDGKVLLYEQYFKDQLILVASPQLIGKKTVKPEELKDLPFVLRERGSGTRESMEENLTRMGIVLGRKQIKAEFSTTASIIEAAKQGIGAAVLSRIAVQEEIRKGSLQEISLKKEKMERFFYLVHHKDRTLPSIYKKFCQFLKQGEA